MKKIFLLLLIILCVAGCGSEEKKVVEEKTAPEKIIVAYFSCTGNTKMLAETAAKVLNADLYEIKPKIPYTETDLEHTDETHRATIEQRDFAARPELAETNADFSKYDVIVLAFPIWWHEEPRIVDTFIETYDFDNKTILPICTSGGSEIGTISENLKMIASYHASWLEGRTFLKDVSEDDLKKYFESVGLIK